MDLQTRKLNTIEYLIGLKDEKIFQKIESMIFEITGDNELKSHFKPFTQQQLNDRADISNLDYLNDRIKTQAQLETESENW